MPITNINGETEPAKMAEQINVLFSMIADKLAENFPRQTPDQTEKVRNQPKFHLQTTDEKEIEKLINNLSLASAIGNDGISPRVLKSAVKPLSILISELFNKSIISGIFPDDLKVARVSPTHKSGDRTDPGNYQLISVLPTISKLFERMAHRQLTHYLEKYSLLSNSQFGFRRHHSTETCCLAMLDKIYKKLDSKTVKR